MHSILNLESDWSNSQTDKPLEKTLVESRFSCFLAHYDRPKLAVVANKNYMLCSLENRDECLWLCRLCRLINQYLFELEWLQPLIKC